MKFKAPEGATSVNIGGEQFTVKNGFLTVPEGDYESLLSVHGYTVCPDKEDKKKDEASPADKDMLTGTMETKVPAPVKFQIPASMAPVVKGKK